MENVEPSFLRLSFSDHPQVRRCADKELTFRDRNSAEAIRRAIAKERVGGKNLKLRPRPKYCRQTLLLGRHIDLTVGENRRRTVGAWRKALRPVNRCAGFDVERKHD